MVPRSDPAFAVMISRIQNWLGRTLTRKFTLLLAGFLALQVLQLGVGVFGILHLGEEGAFSNEAGRQRYRTLLVAVRAEEALAGGGSRRRGGPPARRDGHLLRALQGFP